MKKLLALLLAMAMLFAFAACGSSNDDDDDDDNGKTLSKVSSVKDDDEDEGGDKKEEDTKSEITVSIPDASVSTQIDDYIDANKETYESIMESFEDMFEFEVYASGSSMVYSYKYLIDLGDIDTMKEALDGAYDTSKSAMLSDLKLLQETVPGAESIIVKYLTKDGTVITTQEYK